jgi:hypothetical protein
VIHQDQDGNQDIGLVKVGNMKYIISESQFDMIVPLPLKRRLYDIQNLMYDVMLNNGVSLDRNEYEREDFVNYIIDLVIYDVFPDRNYADTPVYEKVLLHLLGDEIRWFWAKNK